MVVEIASITVKGGEEAAFEAAVRAAAPFFRAAQGCRSLQLQRVVEQPSSYRLVVGWDSLEDHVVTFRQSPGFQEWRRLAAPYFNGPPRVEHVEFTLSAF